MGKPTVAIRCNSDEQKQRWEDAVEDSEEYSSISHLIRRSVERELSGGFDAEGGGGRDERVGEILTVVQDLRTRVDDLDDNLDHLTRTMNSDYDSEATTAAWESLPEGAAKATTAEGVSAGTPYDADELRVALEQLAETTSAVRRIEFEQLRTEGDDTTTVEFEGRQVEIESGPKAVRKRNPLFFKVV